MARQSLKFLTDQQIADVHEKLVVRDGGQPGYRQGASLAAVLDRVRNMIRFGGSRCTNPELIAALTTYAISIGEPVNDGNRRTALACGLMVLRVNGCGAEPEAVALLRLLVAASAGERSQEKFAADYIALIRQAEIRQAQGKRPVLRAS